MQAEKIFSIQKYPFLKSKRREINGFSIEENKKLTEIKNSFPDLTWNHISDHFTNKSGAQIRKHWHSTLDPKLIKGRWTSNEDAMILEWVKTNGPKSWNLANIKGRNAKQIRERYTNYIKFQLQDVGIPTKEIEGTDELTNHSEMLERKDSSSIFPPKKWSEEMENELIVEFIKHGTKWSSISSKFNVSENEIKNKFYSLLRRTSNQYFKDIKVKEKHKSKRESASTKLINSMMNNCTGIFDSLSAGQPKKKRVFQTKSELLKYVPMLIDIRGIKLTNELKSQFDSNYIDKERKHSNEKSNSDIKFGLNDEDSNMLSMINQISKNIQFCDLDFFKTKWNLDFSHEPSPFYNLQSLTNTFEFEDESFKSIGANLECGDIITKRKEALKKVFEMLHKKKCDIRRLKIISHLKSSIVFSLQLDILNKIMKRVKLGALERIFYYFKRSTDIS